MTVAQLTHKVLITDYTWPNVEPERKILEEAGIELVIAPSSDEKTLASYAADVDAIMFCFAEVPETVVRAARKCLVASRYGIGVDNIDKATCSELGIVVTNVPDYCVDEVADHVMAMVLSFNRHIGPLDRAVKAGGWGKTPLPKHSRRLRDTTFGIVGIGRIGRAVARRAGVFGMRVLAFDPYVKPSEAPKGIEMAPLDRLLAQSDFVSLHTPLTDETRALIGRAELKIMKPTAFIVNAARGPLIDDVVLVEALRAGEIAGAGIDVTPTEPPSADHPLFQMDNVIVTPHTAFHSQEALLELEERTAREVVRVLNGEMPENLVNPEVLGHTRASINR